MSVRTRAVEAAGWFRTDLPYCGDFEFWCRLGRRQPWFISRIKITGIRSHEASVSSTMNTKGEQTWQLNAILEPIYRNLVSRGYSPALVRLMFTINYISLQRYLAVKAFLRGKGEQYSARRIARFGSFQFFPWHSPRLAGLFEFSRWQAIPDSSGETAA